MKTLTGSSLKAMCLYQCLYKERGFCPAGICFLGFPESKIPRFSSTSLSVSLQHKINHPIISASAHPSSDAKAYFEEDDIQIEDTSAFKTVHVKFQLQKECQFGEQFFIIGDDPVLGSWDPLDAVRMSWSDGHLWSVEMDMPIGKTIMYKFILKGEKEEVIWQPGPDRVLETWETKRIITVSEDWSNAELQNIIEEENVTEEGPTFDEEEMTLIAENLTEHRGAMISDSNNKLESQNGQPKHTRRLVANNMIETKQVEDHNNNSYGGWTGVLANNEVANGANISIDNGEAVNVDVAERSAEDSLVCDEGAPVLVPGLSPVLTAETEEQEYHEFERNTNATVLREEDKIQELNATETIKINLNSLREEPVIDSSLAKETTEMISNYKHELHDIRHVEQQQSNAEASEHGIFESDIQWGKKTLQKFLANFGFFEIFR